MIKVLVTGGSGFLGRAVCARLAEAGHQLRSLSRTPHPRLEDLGVDQRLADLREDPEVRDAAKGCDAVIHCAAKAGMWGPASEYEQVNVTGTRHVLEACRAHGIGRLVYTSSPSVVLEGRDVHGVDESVPYPRQHLGPYPRTKAVAEREVLGANSPSLATVSLRPHLIWGPDDPHFLPRLVDRARAGRLRILGSGRKLVDITYVDNAAEAHLLALDRLEPESPLAGRAYFLSQGFPVPIDAAINALLIAAGLPPETRRLPVPLARAAALGLEWIHRLRHLPAEPLVTRELVANLATSHWFDISAARRDLGYTPRISVEEGLRRTAAHLAAAQQRTDAAS